MHLIRGLHNFTKKHPPCILTIGNFDGMHIGHQAIIQQMQQLKTKTHLPIVIILFEPHPKEFFRHEILPARLMRLREKLEILKTYDIDTVLLLRFNENFSALTAEQFLKQILLEKIQMRYIVSGENFYFGYRKKGDFNYLQQISTQHHFTIAPANMITLPDKTQQPRMVSSTWLREALRQADLKTAQKLLNRPYSICGRVIHGTKRGRNMHFPTANIHLHRSIPPLTGVYIVSVEGIRPHALPGTANIGTRPTIGGKNLLLEIYLLDFDEDIYGKHLRVNFLKNLRPEKHFDNLTMLEAQIRQDEKQTRQFFKISKEI